MTILTCPTCSHEQDTKITQTTYSVQCERCGEQFDIPRKHRENKREIQEVKSKVNVRIGIRSEDHNYLHVAWTVQSAEKHNQFLEKRSTTVDISSHEEKLYWYVGIFKALQRMEAYKSARIWVKHSTVIDHLRGEISIDDNDLREQMKTRIITMADEKFYGCEFGETDTIGHDIKEMLSEMTN